MKQTKDKPTVNEAVLKDLKAMIEPASPGRVQRGISWPAWMDEAVNQYLETINTEIVDADQRMDRSRLIQIAIGQLLRLSEPAPKVMPARPSMPKYVPLAELGVAQ
jgi:hypothetical protein